MSIAVNRNYLHSLQKLKSKRSRRLPPDVATFWALWFVFHPRSSPEMIRLTFLRKMNESSPALTKDEASADASLIIVAATDTSVQTVITLLRHVSLNTDCIQRLLSEIKTVEVSGNIDTVALLELPYLDACVQEALRLMPPGPFGNYLLYALVPNAPRFTTSPFRSAPNHWIYRSRYRWNMGSCWNDSTRTCVHDASRPSFLRYPFRQIHTRALVGGRTKSKFRPRTIQYDGFHAV